MLRVHAALEAFLRDVRQATGSESASLFVPSAPAEERPALLLHDGAPAVPELADEAEAEAFHREHTDGAPVTPHLRPLIHGGEVLAWLGLATAHSIELAESSLQLGVELARHARWVGRLLGDPVTGLPGRVEFHAFLDQALRGLSSTDGPLAVVLFGPDDFGGVNQRHGRDAGDRTIREFAGCLSTALGSTFSPSRYGGAMFATSWQGRDVEASLQEGERVRRQLTARRYLDGLVRLRASAGFTLVEQGDRLSADELLHRTEQALNIARWAGGNCVRGWDPEQAGEAARSSDPLSGVLSGNRTKDYRNMRLLADTVAVVAATADLTKMAEQVAERLSATLRSDRLGLYEWRGDEDRLLAWIGSEPTPPSQPPATVRRIRADQRAIAEETGGLSAYAVPLAAGEISIGCLYIAGDPDRLTLDRPDLTFLEALGTQLAVALDRARLADLEQRWQQRERERLQTEVDELRQVLQQAELVGRSRPMRTLLSTARRVAKTDATVLVCGESGTGKELLSRTIHELSPRRDKPVVVVDCAAIPATLIESELFGHEKGAYTGAHGRKTGRLVEADGGTVILDEIGELPLEVQSKLLRFVQEKQVLPVGGNRVRTVDARLVAATNRDLERESKAGRFRGDLFHRLNVIRLELPPLRDRPEDIAPLADHFLKQFCTQYQKGVLYQLTPEAEAALVAYPWPGNVRELRNRIMQAVILSESPEIDLASIGLDEPEATTPALSGLAEAVDRLHGTEAAAAAEEAALVPSVDGPVAPAPAAAVAPAPTAPRANSPTDPRHDPRHGPPLHPATTTVAVPPLESLPSAPAGRPAEPGSPADAPAPPTRAWPAVLEALGRAIDTTAAGSGAPLPLGRWLADDLVLEAHAAAGGVLRRAAELLGLPEATFRRRFRKAERERDSGLATRSPWWLELRPLLGRWVASGENLGDDLLRRSREALLEQAILRYPGAEPQVAALMGVTRPTLRGWLEDRDDLG